MMVHMSLIAGMTGTQSRFGADFTCRRRQSSSLHFLDPNLRN